MEMIPLAPLDSAPLYFDRLDTTFTSMNDVTWHIVGPGDSVTAVVFFKLEHRVPETLFVHYAENMCEPGHALVCVSRIRHFHDVVVSQIAPLGENGDSGTVCVYDLREEFAAAPGVIRIFLPVSFLGALLMCRPDVAVKHEVLAAL